MTVQKTGRFVRNDGTAENPSYVEYIPDVAARAIGDEEGRSIASYYARVEDLKNGLQGMRILSELGQGNVGNEYTPVYLKNGFPVRATEVANLGGDQVFGGRKRFDGEVTLAGKTTVSGGTTVTGDVEIGRAVLKVGGASTVGSESKPIFIKDGVPTVAPNVVDTTSEQTIGGAKTFTANVSIDKIEPLLNLNSQTDHGFIQLNTPSDVNAIIIHEGYVLLRKVNRLLEGDSRTLITKGYVSAIDGVTNNLIHNIGNETIEGNKTFKGRNISRGSWVSHEFICENFKLSDPSNVVDAVQILFKDADRVEMGRFRINTYDTGACMMQIAIKTATGMKWVTIADGRSE